MLPQLSLTAPQSSDRLKEECTDLLLSPTDFEAAGLSRQRSRELVHFGGMLAK